jgi:hypothetical protein
MMMIMNASDCRRLRSGSAGVYLAFPCARLCSLACGCSLPTCGFLSRLSVLLSLSLSTSALHRRPACLSTILLSIAHADVFRIRMRSSGMRVRPPEYAFCRVSPSPNCYIPRWVPDFQLQRTRTRLRAGSRLRFQRVLGREQRPCLYIFRRACLMRSARAASRGLSPWARCYSALGVGLYGDREDERRVHVARCETAAGIGPQQRGRNRRGPHTMARTCARASGGS